jgi:hypothetical protein
MLGLIVMGLLAFMIFTLIRNALLGVQLSDKETYTGTVELIIPLTARSEFYLGPWLANLENLRSLSGRLKVHVLIDGHHPSITAWEEVQPRVPFLELHTFTIRPEAGHPVAWMIKQVADQISGDVVIIGDAELVGSEACFVALSRLIQEKQCPYIVLPQTAKLSTLGEAIATVNPTLAMASVFGFRRLRKNLAHPLLSIAQVWIGMPRAEFQKLDLTRSSSPSWKQALAEHWDREVIFYHLAFGEKFLMRHYPTDLNSQISQLHTYWEELWATGDRAGLWRYIGTLFIWSFPLFFFYSHPFWSIASMGLLVIYRFFSKVVFQESWRAVFLHLAGCVIWVATLVLWGVRELKNSRTNKYLRKN